jgi:nicotinamide-nucleotide amidase
MELIMNTSCIISIGNELLKGKIDDTNASYISMWLNQRGITVKKRISVNDNVDDIYNALTESKGSDIVIITGGLGPTDDDLTREGFAKFLNKELVFSDEAWSKIDYFFKSRNIPTAESNKKQAMIIDGCEVLPNDNGTAPGLLYNHNGIIYVLLPGPPKENRPMMDNYLDEKLKNLKFVDSDITTVIIRVYNTGESTLADIFKDYKSDCSIGYYFTDKGYVEIHITKSGPNKNKNQKDVDYCYSQMTTMLSKNKIYFTANNDLSYLLFDSLRQNNLTISFAESITGGKLSAEFVKNAGVSDVFYGGVVVYSNESKIKILGVNEDTLINHGAVSEETVKEMVVGLKKIFNTDICIATSGIAGPSGGNDKKPVGLVYFGFLMGDKIITKKEIFTGNRIRIINKAVNFCYTTILELIEENKFFFK